MSEYKKSRLDREVDKKLRGEDNDVHNELCKIPGVDDNDVHNRILEEIFFDRGIIPPTS